MEVISGQQSKSQFWSDLDGGINGDICDVFLIDREIPALTAALTDTQGFSIQTVERRQDSVCSCRNKISPATGQQT